MANPQDDLTYGGLKKALDKAFADRLWDDWVKHESLFVRRDTAAASGQGFTFDPSAGLMVTGSPAPLASFIGSTLPAWKISTGTMTIGVDWGRGEQAELPVEKEVGAIKAYRVWEWGLDDNNRPALHAVVQGTEWAGPLMVADCVPENGTKSGSVVERHGLYAAKSLRGILDSRYDADVVGEVALFGRVVEHEHGFRAEKAMIRRLVLLDPLDLLDHPTLDRDLAERYGCEVSTDIRTLMEDA